VVVLDPDPASIQAREAGRAKLGYGEWEPTALVETLRTTTPRVGLWLDTTRLTPGETVNAVLERLDEALVPDPRS
jgi:hypothetical protein